MVYFSLNLDKTNISQILTNFKDKIIVVKDTNYNFFYNKFEDF